MIQKSRMKGESLRSNFKGSPKVRPWHIGILALIAVFAFAIPFVASAQSIPFPYWGTDPPLLPCTGLECVNLCQLLSLGQRLIYFGMTLAVLFFAPLFIIWGGVLILISGGSQERLGKGKTVLTSTLVGIVITLGAFLIVSTFLWLLGNPTSGANRVSWPNIVRGFIAVR